MKISIVSPEKTLYMGEADSVIVPGTKGRFEILKNHAPIISSLSAGLLECKGAQPLTLEISGGFIEVSRNEVSICVEI